MCADISLARAKLGYRPQVGLQEGLRRMMEKDPRFQPVPAE
jgi:nucleoside-diphosphate-sugar epimerase